MRNEKNKNNAYHKDNEENNQQHQKHTHQGSNDGISDAWRDEWGTYIANKLVSVTVILEWSSVLVWG